MADELPNPSHASSPLSSLSATLAANPSEKLGKCASGPKQGFHLWVDTLSKLAVTFGALVGGLWAFNLYLETTSPTLEHKTEITSQLNWPEGLPSKDSCWAEYAVSLKNSGTRPFDIDSHTVTIWVVDGDHVPAPTKEPLSFMSLLRDDEIVYPPKSTDPIAEDIQGHYPPGSESHSSAVFLIKNPAATPPIVPTKSGVKKTLKHESSTSVVVMRIDVDGHTDEPFYKSNQKVHDSSWTYDKLCRSK